MIAALVGALVQALIGLAEAVAALLALLTEFLFLALTQGLSAARKTYEQRKKERASNHCATASGDCPAEAAPTIGRRRAAIMAAVALLAMICCVAVWAVRDHIRRQRIAETRARVERLADAFANQITDDDVADPEPGRLRDHDAWQQQIELFVDKMLLGSLVVVRSPGPDGESGSVDDILATRVIRARQRMSVANSRIAASKHSATASLGCCRVPMRSNSPGTSMSTGNRERRETTDTEHRDRAVGSRGRWSAVRASCWLSVAAGIAAERSWRRWAGTILRVFLRVKRPKRQVLEL